VYLRINSKHEEVILPLKSAQKTEEPNSSDKKVSSAACSFYYIIENRESGEHFDH
jgi:hypothetical protein